MKLYYPDGKIFNNSIFYLKNKKKETYYPDTIKFKIDVLRRSLETRQLVYPGALLETVFDDRATGTIGGSFWYFEPSQNGLHFLWIRTPYGNVNTQELGGDIKSFEDNISKKYGTNVIVDVYGGRAVKGTIIPVLLTNWHNVVTQSELADLKDPSPKKEIRILDPQTNKKNPVAEVFKSLAPSPLNSGKLVKDATYDAALLRIREPALPIDLPISIFPVPKMSVSERESYLSGNDFPYPEMNVWGRKYSKNDTKLLYQSSIVPDYLMRYGEFSNPQSKGLRGIAHYFTISFEKGSQENIIRSFLGNLVSPFREKKENWINILENNVTTSSSKENIAFLHYYGMGRGLGLLDEFIPYVTKISSASSSTTAQFIVSKGVVFQKNLPSLNAPMTNNNTMIVGISDPRTGIQQQFAIARGMYVKPSPDIPENQNYSGHSGSLVFRANVGISLSNGSMISSSGPPIGLITGKVSLQDPATKKNFDAWIVISLQDIYRSFDFLLFKEELFLTPFQFEEFLSKGFQVPPNSSLLLL